jgi:hypothetical protein
MLVKYIGFKNPPTVLLKLVQEEWKYLKFQIEHTNNKYYNVVDYYGSDNSKYYIILKNINLDLTYITAFLNIRHPDFITASVCKEIIINKNELITE